MDSRISQITDWLGTGSINLFGRPFAGKDTQGRILAELLKAKLVGGGEILRSQKDPARIEKIMAEGGIIPSDYYLQTIEPFLARAEFKGQPLILDSVGRRHGEEKAVIKACEAAGHPIKVVLLLKLSDEEIWRRFEAAASAGDRGSRADDSREALANRLQKFIGQTQPVLEFYRQKGLLAEVNGENSRQAVTEQILDALLKMAASNRRV